MKRKVILALALLVIPAAIFAAQYNSQNFPERGEVAFSGVTGTTGGSANTVLTTTYPINCLLVENTTDVEVMITRSSTNLKRVPPYSFRALDLGTNAVSFASGTVFKAYVTGPTGTTGNVEILTCAGTR